MNLTETEKRDEKEGRFARLCIYCAKHCDEFTDSQMDVALSKMNAMHLIVSSKRGEKRVLSK